MMMANKTKAALQGRQCRNAYQMPSQLITLIDQVNSLLAGGAKSTAPFLLVCVTLRDTRCNLVERGGNGARYRVSNQRFGLACNCSIFCLASREISSSSFAALSLVSAMLARVRTAEASASYPTSPSWRRAISPRTAVTIKPAVLSSSRLSISISCIKSCGKRMFFICDLLFTFPVAISSPRFVLVCIHYTKKCVSKMLDLNTHLELMCVYTNYFGVQTAKPRSARTLAGLLITTLRKVTL